MPDPHPLFTFWWTSQSAIVADQGDIPADCTGGRTSRLTVAGERELPEEEQSLCLK